MAKKIVVHFRDTFKPGEFERLSASLVSALRTEFQGFIVHVDAVKDFYEAVVIHVYGAWAEGEAETSEARAKEILDSVVDEGAWTHERHLARQGLEATLAAADEARQEKLVEDETSEEEADERYEEGQS